MRHLNEYHGWLDAEALSYDEEKEPQRFFLLQMAIVLSLPVSDSSPT